MTILITNQNLDNTSITQRIGSTDPHNNPVSITIQSKIVVNPFANITHSSSGSSWRFDSKSSAESSLPSSFSDFYQTPEPYLLKETPPLDLNVLKALLPEPQWSPRPKSGPITSVNPFGFNGLNKSNSAPLLAAAAQSIHSNPMNNRVKTSGFDGLRTSNSAPLLAAGNQHIDPMPMGPVFQPIPITNLVKLEDGPSRGNSRLSPAKQAYLCLHG